jgi:predicted outer membrane protein
MLAMFSFVKVRKTALAAASVVCLAASAEAQTTIDSTTGKPEANQSGINDAGAPGSQPARRQATPPNGRQAVDTQGPEASAGDLSQQIASCLVLGNQEEVALAEIAQKRAEHPEVKKFAAHMIEQHQQAVTKLEQAVPQVAGLTLGAAGEQVPQQGRSASAAGNQSPELELVKAIKQQCLELTQKEMEGKQGAEFDKCYIGQQIGAHVGMLAQLRGSKSFANPELQAVIAEGEQMAAKHLDEAKKIMAQLDGAKAQPARTSQRTAPAAK